jgi:mRNA interferase RelE/StbE
MPKLDGMGIALDFLKGLQPKVAAQIAKKIMALNLEAHPVDSKLLAGYASYRRVDIGEFRIIYRYESAQDTVTIVMVGKRNDDEVYRKLSRQ